MHGSSAREEYPYGLSRWQEDALRAMPVQHYRQIHTEELRRSCYGEEASLRRLERLTDLGLVAHGAFWECAGWYAGTWEITPKGVDALAHCDILNNHVMSTNVG